jgi:hypothetical protein
MNPIDVFKEAGSQFRKCAVPTVIAVTAGAVIAKLGIPVVSLGLAAACAYAYVRGYRVQINRKG